MSNTENKHMEWATTTVIFVFLYSKDICICLVGQIYFNVSETCERVAIHEALLQCQFISTFFLNNTKNQHNVRKD